MNKMLNKVLSAAVAATLTLSLAACGGTAKPAETAKDQTAAPAAETKKEEAKKDEKVKLKIFSQYSLPEEKQPFDYAKEQVAKAMPNVELELDIEPQDDNAKLKTLAASGDLPDIIRVTAGIVDLFKKSNNIIQLDQYVKELKIEDRIRPAYKGLLWDSEKHCYAVPRTASPTYIMYYNKELFEKNNIKVPTNYDEFLASIKAFSAKGIMPVSLFAKEAWPGVMLFDAFATRYDAGGLMKVVNDKKGSITEDAYKKAASQLYECVKAGMLSKAAYSTDYDTAFNQFTSGKCAYFFNGAWALGPIGDKLGDKVDYLDFPLADAATVEAAKLNRPGGGFDGGYSVAANSKNKDIAAKYACLFALETANGRVIKASEAYPLTVDDVKPEKPYPAIALKYAEESKKFKSTTRFPWGLNEKANVVLGENVAKLLTGGYPVDKFIADTDKALQDALK
ncbi:MAG: extracellular solute-binding protein [Clostridia bacterium]|nr:extracellular solute-binding protein [Clostridia bacterium]